MQLTPLEGRWNVVTGVSRAQPSQYRVKKLAKPKPPHGDLLNFYASAHMGAMLLVSWDASTDMQLAAINVMLSDARPHDTVIVLTPPACIGDWASRIERAALLAGANATPSQRVVTILITTPQAYLERFTAFSKASLTIVDAPPYGLEPHMLPSAPHTIVLCPPTRTPPDWSLSGHVCAFDARSHVALCSAFPPFDVQRADVESSDALLSTLVGNVDAIAKWPQVVVAHPLESARRDALVDALSRIVIQYTSPHPDDPSVSVERRRFAKVDVLDGSVSRSARDEVLRDVGRGAVDVMVVSIAAWVNALYGGDAWLMKGARALHFIDADTYSDVDAWSSCISAVSFPKSYDKVAMDVVVQGGEELRAPRLLVLDYLVVNAHEAGGLETAVGAYEHHVLGARAQREADLAALVERSVPMPLTAKWKPRAPSTSSTSASSTAAAAAAGSGGGGASVYWTAKRLQLSLPFEGGGGWRVWSEGWNLLLQHTNPVLQQVEIKRAAVKELAKGALEQLVVELAHTPATGLNPHEAYARLVELTFERLAAQLGAPPA